MSFQRSRRVAEQMRVEIAQIIREEIKDPRVGFVSITSVEVTRDLRHAKVFISVFGDDREQEAAMQGLHAAAGFVRREIGKRIKLRLTPEIHFCADPSIRHGAEISRILHGLTTDPENNGNG